MALLKLNKTKKKTKTKKNTKNKKSQPNSNHKPVSNVDSVWNIFYCVSVLKYPLKRGLGAKSGNPGEKHNFRGSSKARELVKVSKSKLLEQKEW